MKSGNFIKRHWNGEISLPVAYWGIGIFFSFSIILLISLLNELIDSFTPSLTYSSWVVLLSYPILWIISLWIYVGIWKSSTNYVQNGSSKTWGYLAKIAVIIGLLQVCALAISTHLPIMQKMSEFALGSDPMGTVSIAFLDDGKTLYIQGAFGNGSSKSIISTLEKNPSVKRLNLNSYGGRLKEVIRLSSEVQKRKLETYTEDRCLSFCTVIFLSGMPRYSTPGARIGFHAPHFLDGEHLQSIGIDESKKLYQSFNLPSAFIERIFLTPNSDMWYPSYQELVSFGVVTNSSLGGESNFLRTYLTNYSSEQIQEYLLKIKLFATYENKFPGIVKKVSEKMIAAMKSGINDADLLTAGRTFLIPYQSKAIAQSTPKIRISFSELAYDQSKRVETLGPQYCHAFLSGTLDITKNLPKEIVDREIALTNDALNSTYLQPQKFSIAEFQKIIQTVVANMSDAEINAINDLKLAPSSSTCSSLVKLYGGINILPPIERDIAIYGLLNQ
jgi:hypothetical protein